MHRGLESKWAGHASHAVLWTKQSFEDDVKIEYEYTRLDSSLAVAVNILYIQATGSGEGPFEADIRRWADQRTVPAMRMYFDHMHTYAISYAAFGKAKDHPDNDYIRARRYLPEASGLDGTALEPLYTRTGLFKTGVPHRITVIKRGRTLTMDIRGPNKTLLCRWENTVLPPITEGRIGLRHMATRGARYRDFRISTPCGGDLRSRP